jgi:hypothetical protein
MSSKIDGFDKLSLALVLRDATIDSHLPTLVYFYHLLFTMCYLIVTVLCRISARFGAVFVTTVPVEHPKIDNLFPAAAVEM